ncbi:MAG: hypothetical protein IJN17_04980 [Clostridia bacterium]|nr:hypothetical protein [Oscillospiraceae bacterium]MBQ6702290.1 hypothetical protein [Clostridia bacterium]
MKNHSIIAKRTDVLSKEETVLDYSLIMTDRRQHDLFSESAVYSVLILQIENGITTEYEFLYDIARDEENAVAILDVLVYNNVMPTNAKEVLAEIL